MHTHTITLVVHVLILVHRFGQLLCTHTHPCSYMHSCIFPYSCTVHTLISHLATHAQRYTYALVPLEGWWVLPSSLSIALRRGGTSHPVTCHTKYVRTRRLSKKRVLPPVQNAFRKLLPLSDNFPTNMSRLHETLGWRSRCSWGLSGNATRRRCTSQRVILTFLSNEPFYKWLAKGSIVFSDACLNSLLDWK